MIKACLCAKGLHTAEVHSGRRFSLDLMAVHRSQCRDEIVKKLLGLSRELVSIRFILLNTPV